MAFNLYQLLLHRVPRHTSQTSAQVHLRGAKGQKLKHWDWHPWTWGGVSVGPTL